MIFKTLNGELTVFNKTLISTKDHLKSFQPINATAYNKNGTYNLQELLVNSSQSVSTFTKLSNAFKTYNGNLSKSTQLQNAYIQAVGKQNITLGNYLAGLNGAKASMLGYITSLVAAKAASIALNTAISMGISLAIGGLISQISKWIHAQEEARQKSIELTNAYKEQKESLDTQIEKYKELKKKLDNENLTTDETCSIKEQLLEIQKALIESYGDEVSTIDLINGKYREQLGLLSELSKEKATDYVTENRDVFSDAKEELEKIRKYNIGTISWSTISPEKEDQKKLIEYIRSYSELLDLTYSGATAQGVTYASANIAIKANVEDADKIMHQFAKDLEKFGKDNNIDVSGLLEGISGQLKKTWTDELKEHKTIYDEFMNAEIVRNDTLRPLYRQSIQAVEDYNNALSSGEGIAEAKANLDSVQQSVQNTTGELEGSQEIFDGIFDGINKSAESVYNLVQSFENDELVKGYAEQLKGLTYIDLKAINFEDNVQSPGEEAFGALIDVLGLSKDEVQNLIDKLVELGYVQGEIQNSTPNESPISFSSRFKTLWDSEEFSSAKSDLTNLSKEAGITENDILSLAKGNETLAVLLKDSGISAQFAAACFNRVCNGADGFSAITEDALALDKVLHGMDESLESVSQAKSKYDKAISGDDYNTEFENYQEAYKSAMEMFENGEYGKHFQSAMEYLLGDDSYTMGIDEMYESMKSLESVFGENGENGLGFLDRLYSNKDALDGLGSSLEKLSDGTYEYDLKPEEFEAIGEAVGMTAEEVAACTNALGMFGNHTSYDIGELENKLKGMSISAEGSKDAFLSLQGMESMLSSLGYTGQDIFHIMEQIKDMGSINLIDFSKDDEESIKGIVSQLKELDMLELDGKNINVDSLIENLASSFHMASDDITSFLSSLGENYNFTDNSGNDVSQAEAADKAQQPELYITKEAADSATESVNTVNAAVELLNNKKLVGINEEFSALKGAVSSVIQEVGRLIIKVDEFSEKAGAISSGVFQNVQETTSGVLGTNTGNTGGKTGNKTGNKTGKLQGMAKAAGTGNIGIKKTEIALINELGHETIIDPKKGTYEIVQGGAQFRELKKGQIVLNHKQTEGLLRNGKISTFGKMLFSGNANLKGSSYAAGAASSRNPAAGSQWTDNGNSADSSKTPGTDASSTDNGKQQSIEIFNFIEIAISRVEDALRRLKGKAEETFRSFTSRGKAYTNTIKKTTVEIGLQQQAYSKYMERANSFGLDEYWAAQVRNGSINIADVEDDNLKEQIKGYQEWYNKASECLKTIEELKKTQKELAREKIELSITQYDKKISHAEANVRRIQNNVGLKEAYGGHASDIHYKDMNKYTKEQIDYTIKQNHGLKELQKTVTKGSEAWYEYQRQIDSNNNSIKQLTTSMAENAAAAASIAGQTAERKNQKEDAADEKIDAKLSTSSNNERTKQLLQKKITNINDRQDHLGGAYASSVKARKSYGKKIQNVSTKGVSKKNKKLFTDAIKSVKAKKLVPASTIGGIVNAMKSATGKEYSALSKLLSYCNYYNAYKNAEEENKLNYQMYALTAQADKKELREKQLQSNLDHNQKKADRNTMSIAETAAGKNHNADAKVHLANANATSYKNSRIKYEADRDTAGKKANFSSNKAYKNLKNKKLKDRLKKKVLDAIKYGKKIDKEGMKAVSEYCKTYLNGDMTYYYNCEAYNESVENVLSAQEAETLANTEAYAAKLQARRDKTSNTISGRESKNEFYAAKAKNQTTASGKNKYVDKQSKNIAANLKSSEEDYTFSTNELNAAKENIKDSTKDKSKKKIISEIKSKFTSKDKLIPAEYIEKAYTVSNSFGLACENYNEALEAKNAAKETLDMNKETAKTKQAALALEKMSNIEAEYSNKQGVYGQKSKQINSAMDLAQAKGYSVSTKFYDKLISQETKNNQSLADERDRLVKSLQESLADGSIVKYSDEWYEACADIDNVTNAIDESTKSLAEFQNQIRQIKWDNFDYLQDHIKNVSSEIQFMRDELSREKLTDDETGGLTKEGEAVAHLRAASYTTHKKQAEDYKKEIGTLDKDLAKDPYNKILLERKAALMQSYQDSVKAAQDEKYAIIDLYSQGYDALSNKIHSLISDYGELLDAEKNAYDYQDAISSKTKEISQIRKQLAAYAGDTSEETKAKLQTLTVSLEDAEKDLAETQYDKYISDTKEMLSTMQEDMDEAIQAIIDSLSMDFKGLMDQIDTNSKKASETITEKMLGIGYTSTEEFQTLLNSTSINTTVNNMLTEMKDYHAKMAEYAEQIASRTNTDTAEDTAGTKDNEDKKSNPSDKNEQKNTSKPAQTTVENSMERMTDLPDKVDSSRPKIEDLTWSPIKEITSLTTKVNNYLKSHLKSTNQKREKLSDLNKKFYDKHGKKILSDADAKGLAKLLGVKYDNQKSSGKLYKTLKELGIKGFKAGSIRIPNDQLALLGEKGTELQYDQSEGTLRQVGQGDMIFTAEQTKALWALTQGRAGLSIAGQYQPQPLLHTSEIQSVSQDTNVGDVHISLGGITMNGVNDMKEFERSMIQTLNNSVRIQKAIGNHVLGPLTNGYNSLSGHNYSVH